MSKTASPPGRPTADRILSNLQARLLSAVRPGQSVQVKRRRELSALRSLSGEELREFARRCRAHVVRRLGGSEFEFTHAARA